MVGESVQSGPEVPVAYPDFSKTIKVLWLGHEQYVNSVQGLERHPQRPEYAPKLVSVIPSGSAYGFDMAEITVVYRYVGPAPEQALVDPETNNQIQDGLPWRDASDPVWWEENEATDGEQNQLDSRVASERSAQRAD